MERENKLPAVCIVQQEFGNLVEEPALLICYMAMNKSSSFHVPNLSVIPTSLEVMKMKAM